LANWSETGATDALALYPQPGDTVDIQYITPHTLTFNGTELNNNTVFMETGASVVFDNGSTLDSLSMIYGSGTIDVNGVFTDLGNVAVFAGYETTIDISSGSTLVSNGTNDANIGINVGGSGQFNGGSLDVLGGTFSDQAIHVNGGYAYINSTLTSTDSFSVDGGELEINQPTTASPFEITFVNTTTTTPTPSTLKLDNPALFNGDGSNQIQDFTAGDTLDIGNNSVATLIYTVNSGVGTLVAENGEGTILLDVSLSGTDAASFTQGTFEIASTGTTQAGSLQVVQGSGLDTLIEKSFQSLPKQDVLFQSANGQPAVWQLNGTALSASGAIGSSAGPSWYVVGSGSFFTGDTSDLLWQNTSGQVAVWKVQGTSVMSSGLVGGNPGTSWHVRGTGNFYGDGNTSILWQNDSGAVALWDVNGTSVVQSGAVASNPGPSWHIEGTGDFYSDGGTDVLWQNDSGAVALWELNGTTIAHSTLVANPGPSWHIVGTGDFVGNGDTDILWQNSNGAVAYWDMHGGTIQAGAVISNPGPSWHVVGTGDFNSDGKTDIVFQNDSGAVAVWEMNAGTIQAGAVISNPGTSWSVVGSDQMRFIYSTGANDTLTATPTTPDEFVLANPVAGLHTISGFNPVQDMIELNGGMFASFAAVQAATVNTSGGALINLGNGASLLVAGISASSLQARDFSLT
jgi:hypothetical protein